MLKERQHPRMILYAVLFSISNLTVLAAQQLAVKGIFPGLATRYSPENKIFRCLGGESSIKIERVNDNYCDCIDGSDEPGNSQLTFNTLVVSHWYPDIANVKPAGYARMFDLHELCDVNQDAYLMQFKRCSLLDLHTFADHQIPTDPSS
jgi:hypothetical protein